MACLNEGDSATSNNGIRLQSHLDGVVDDVEELAGYCHRRTCTLCCVVLVWLLVVVGDLVMYMCGFHLWRIGARVIDNSRIF